MMHMPFRDHIQGSSLASVGWLFADLLLALAMLFMVASTVGVRPFILPPPKLAVDTTLLTPSDKQCTGTLAAPQCTITLTETAASAGSVTWTASSDMSDSVVFQPSTGILIPGHAVAITISAFPCHNGSFTFSGSRSAMPITVLWRCTLPQERLDFHYQEITLNVPDVPALLSDSPTAITTVEQQIRGQSLLVNRSVGLAIAYGGAANLGQIAQAQLVANKIYAILKQLGQEGFAFQRASYYVPLYSLGSPLNTVTLDIYLFNS